MNCSASKNLKIYNKIAFVFIWIFLAIGSLCLIASISCGIMTGAGVWTDVILPIGIVGILLAGLQWVYWAFAKGCSTQRLLGSCDLLSIARIER